MSLFNEKQEENFIYFIDISDNVMLVQLIKIYGNFDNDVSITECWIYY